MKPIYDECSLKWRVQGVGLFDTPQEAWRVIRDNERTKMLTLMVSPKMMNDLRALAKERKISISELVRRVIEKEVNANG
jgi:hypothetical protein